MTRSRDYIARAAVLSEVLSLLQSLINTIGGSLSYVNSISFFIFCIPIFLGLRLSRIEAFGVALFLLVIMMKVLFQGVGEYFIKSFFLILTMPLYVLLARRSSTECVVAACQRYKHLIVIIGFAYLAAWVLWGEYRNASTITAFMMMYLGFKSFVDGLVLASFALVMKTQYKIWALVMVCVYAFKNRMLLSFISFSAILSAALLPVALALTDLSWLVLFNASELASLGERLMEVRAFVELLGAHLEYLFIGWPVGQALAIETLSERGYMHSAYLWITGTFGIFLSSLLIFSFINWGVGTRNLYLAKLFLILSNALTFLLFTNPLCTIVLLSRVSKKSN
jgi:hypothetical protein